MNIEYIIILAFSSALQTSILHLLYNKIGLCRIANKWIASLIYVLYFVISLLVSIFVRNQYIMMAIEMALIYLLGSVYKINNLTRIITPLIVVGLFVITELMLGGIMMSILSATMEETQSNLFFYMQGILGSKILVLFAVLIYRTSYKSVKLKGLGIINTCLVIIPVMINALLYALLELILQTESRELETVVLGVALSFLVVMVVIVYVIEYCIKMNYKQSNLEAVNNILNEQVKAFNSLVDNYKFSNKSMHDIRNQLIVLKGMCKSNIDCTNEIEKVESIVDKSRNIVFTGNAGIDAILNEKFNKIEELKLNYEKSILVSRIDVDTMKFSILIANLLDNAIEESLRLKDNCLENKITFKLSTANKVLSVYIKNLYARKEKSIKTQKQNEYKHGYGKEIVEQLIMEMEGSMLVEETETEYIVSVAILQNAS